MRLGQLLPYFEREGYHVCNCTPGSGLKVFPYVSYDEAIEAATANIPATLVTGGMYDRPKHKQGLSKTDTKPQTLKD